MSTKRIAPTQSDVARAAGVSTATVSRFLNAPESVVEETRKRVSDAIETLGYTPNFAAQVMAARRTSTIGAIIPTMENAIFARGLQAFQQELYEHGFTLLVASSAYDPELEKEQIKALTSRGADGLLLIGLDRDPGIYDYLERQNVPALAAWSFQENSPIPCIGFDNCQAMSALTQEVLNLGHRRLGMISGIQSGNDRAGERVRGFRQAIAAYGFPADEMPIAECPYEFELGGDAFAQLMSAQNPPTAIVCGNDVLAIGAAKRAAEMGLQVPEAVSITGFDDIELASIISPSLTTMHVPHREMGRRAAKELVAMVAGQSAGRSASLETTLIMRTSLAAPR